MKKYNYCIICVLSSLFVLTACSRSADGGVENTIESVSVTETGEYYSESGTDSSTEYVVGEQTTYSVDGQAENTESQVPKKAPDFLTEFSDEVVVDEKDFKMWDYENEYYFYKGWENEGFAPCEILFDGRRCKGMYTESGVALIGVQQENASPRCMVVYKDKSMMLSDSVEAVFLDNWLSVYFYDFDGDENDELVICSMKSEAADDNIAVIKLEPFEKLAFKLREPDDFVPLSEMSITDVTWVDKDRIEYNFKIRDWYGNEYDGWSWYGNYVTNYSIPEEDEYVVEHWSDRSFMTREGKIWSTYLPYMQNDSHVSSSFATLHIYYTYDSEEKAFVSDTAVLSYKKLPEDRKGDYVEEEVEIKGRE